MSSPFAQKFFGKKPFTSAPKKQEKDYEAMGEKAAELEKKYSADRGDAPDYEARLMVQKELAKKDSPLNGAYASGAGGMQYVSTAGAFQKLQDQIFKGVEQSLVNKEAAESKEKSMFKSDGTLKNEFTSKYTPKKEESTYKFQTSVGLSDFEKSNKENPYYKGQ